MVEIEGPLLCEQLQISGINCLAWEHKVPKPFYNSTNTGEIVDIINTSGSPVAVSWDSARLSDVNTWVALNGVENAYMDDTAIFLENNAKNNHLLLMGDFMSAYERSKSDSINIRNAVMAVGGAGLIALASMRSKKRELTRREFVTGAFWGAAALIGANTAMSLVADNTTDAVNGCNLNNFANKVAGALNSSVSLDLSVRTGLVIAKQAKMQETSFLAEKSPSQNISVWGTSHLQNSAIVSEIRQVVDNPGHYSQIVFDREVLFLQSQGLSVSEVLDKSTALKVDMAGMVPMSVTKVGDSAFNVLPVVPGDEPIFFDDRILGFSSKNMGYAQVVERIKEEALQVWLA